MSSDARVTLDIADAIARLRLVREDAANAIDGAMVESFAAAVEEIAEDLDGPTPAIRCVLISAAGRAFTVGGDLRYFAERANELAIALGAMVPTYHAALNQLAEVGAPVVCAVNGPIAGGGLGIAWAADVVIAAEDARFATGFDKLGLSGDGGSSWYLPRLVGMRRAQEMLIRGRVLDAAEALEWGLVTEVVPASDLEARAEQIAAELAAGPSIGLARIRRLLRESSDLTLDQHLERENEAMMDTGHTADGAEGVRAFAERRPPDFRGE